MLTLLGPPETILLLDIILAITEFKAHVKNQTHLKQYDAISHPCHRLKSGLTQLSLKLGQE